MNCSEVCGAMACNTANVATGKHCKKDQKSQRHQETAFLTDPSPGVWWASRPKRQVNHEKLNIWKMHIASVYCQNASVITSGISSCSSFVYYNHIRILQRPHGAIARTPCNLKVRLFGFVNGLRRECWKSVATLVDPGGTRRFPLAVVTARRFILMWFIYTLTCWSCISPRL